jgi:hypothetical protein
MNTDEKWQKMLAESASTFAGESMPPYGFATSTLANLKTERRQIKEIERIGWRALLASMAALAIAATVTVSVNSRDGSSDFEPGVRSLVQMENISVS